MLICEALCVPRAAGEPGGPQGSLRGWGTEPSIVPAGEAGRRKINSPKIGREQLVPGLSGERRDWPPGSFLLIVVAVQEPVMLQMGIDVVRPGLR